MAWCTQSLCICQEDHYSRIGQGLQNLLCMIKREEQVLTSNRLPDDNKGSRKNDGGMRCLYARSSDRCFQNWRKNQLLLLLLHPPSLQAWRTEKGKSKLVRHHHVAAVSKPETNWPIRMQKKIFLFSFLCCCCKVPTGYLLVSTLTSEYYKLLTCAI